MIEATTETTLRETLRDKGLRATNSRVRVMKCLLAAGGPLTHAEVYDRIHHFGMNRATVFRNLNDLVDVGLLARGDMGDHLWRFEIRRATSESDGHRHAHFVCKDCGTVECIPGETVAHRVRESLPPPFRSLASLEVQLRGVCSDCVSHLH